MRLWDIANARELRRFDNHPGAVLCVAVSPDGARALTGTGHRWADAWKPADSYGVQLWDLEKGTILGRFETHEPIHSVAFSTDGRRAAAGGEDGVVHSWDLPL
jgi:WD40 repeat protein